MLDPCGQLFRASVGFATLSLPSYDRALWALRTWLDSWTGIGHVLDAHPVRCRHRRFGDRAYRLGDPMTAELYTRTSTD